MTAAPIVIVGDTLLDRDVDGAVTRVCPDAAAPVLDERYVDDRPGGAGLAAVLAVGQGHPVVLISAFASDAAGARLAALLTAAGIDLHPLPLGGATAEKIRLRTRGQVLLRLDRGGLGAVGGALSPATEELLASAAAVVVSDYGRGVARLPALRAALAATTAPVVWDPHPRGPAAVAGARLVTPNETEVRQLTGQPVGDSRVATATAGADQLRRRWQAGAVAVTMGGDGALLCHCGSVPLMVPAPASADGDTCGAGDRFATAAALALAGGALVSEAVQTAVELACRYVLDGGAAGLRRLLADDHDQQAGPVRSGVADLAHPTAEFVAAATGERIGPQAAGELVARVRAAGGTVVASGGCFDLLHAGHVTALQAARQLGDCLIVCVNSDASVARLKGPDRPVVTQRDRARLLAALGCVDAVVVFDEDTPHAVLSWLRPDIWVKGGDYAGDGAGQPDLPEAGLLRRWGGQTAIVPYLDGRSTTNLIAMARARGVPDGHVELRKEPA
ncbi:PfkB family carbohydrate kinase [Micromonospora sp. NBC_01813]|uniref:PfkB family carbohydrate kinase n=1 Tax=Micromonospora sp. NBC_01813 TaxID=2975988 RepID=UPI002DD9E5A8|nr:PfkB family carbohydrate kinase [Micromonospora sp. NBC_01813]WSA11052.1 PfkB family carbohydrate kinase [Micromonospora sp. NBC_01813]